MEVHQIAPEEVVVDEKRARTKFEKGALVRLEKSIESYGQIQPGVCCPNPENGRFHLVAGERRLRVCTSLGKDFEFVLKGDITDPVLLREIELEENLQREDLTWKEEVEAKEELHRLKQGQIGSATTGPGSSGWSMDDTAAALGESRGLISQDVELAMWSKEIPEVAAAKNKTEAKKIVKRLKESLARKEAIQTAEGKAEPKAKSVEERVQQIGKHVHLASMEERLAQFPDEHFNIVVFDPPWGVGFEGGTGGSTKGYDDAPEGYAMLFIWLKQIWQKMKPDSHLYMFFGIVHHSYVYETLETVGFETNRMPLLWHKKGAHRTQNPKKWHGRCYEPIAFARKGNKDLIVEGRPDVITTPMASPKMRGPHSSAKHPDLLVELLRRSGYPGDRVLDPMSGSGMVGVAADYLQLPYELIEKDKEFHTTSIFNILKGYASLVLPEPKPSPSKHYDKWATNLESKHPTSYEGLEPGTLEWKQYWKTHPEEQDAMLAWKQGRRKG